MANTFRASAETGETFTITFESEARHEAFKRIVAVLEQLGVMHLCFDYLYAKRDASGSVDPKHVDTMLYTLDLAVSNVMAKHNQPMTSNMPSE